MPKGEKLNVRSDGPRYEKHTHLDKVKVGDTVMIDGEEGHFKFVALVDAPKQRYVSLRGPIGGKQVVVNGHLIDGLYAMDRAVVPGRVRLLDGTLCFPEDVVQNEDIGTHEADQDGDDIMNDEQLTAAQKVVKLLAKAERTSNEAEREAFLAGAVKVQARYAIDDALIRSMQGDRVRESRDDIEQMKHWFGGAFRDGQMMLAFNVGNAFGIHGVKYQRKVQRDGRNFDEVGLEWTGFRSDIEKADVLLASLLMQWSTAQERWGKNFVKANPNTSAAERTKQRKSFALAFADGVRGKLAAGHKEAVADAVAEGEHTAESVALALQGRDEQVKTYVDEHYGRLSHRGGSRRLAAAGAAAGRAAGSSADTGQPTLRGSQKALES